MPHKTFDIHSQRTSSHNETSVETPSYNEDPRAHAVPNDAELLLTKLLHAHEAYYDVERDKTVFGRAFRGYAEFHSHAEQYVLTQRAKLWEADTHERIFFDTADHLDRKTLEELTTFMCNTAIRLVQPAANQMSSDLSLVVIAQTVDADVKNIARKTRFRKDFLFGLRGWCDFRLAVVDLSACGEGRITTNAAGKPLRRAIEANMPSGKERA